MLLEGDAEKSCNQHIATTDKTQALQDMWRNLKDNFGYHEQTLSSMLMGEAHVLREHQMDSLSSCKTFATVGAELALTT